MTEQLPQNDDPRFDRLVDGELSPAEYEELLAALDDEPGGWRRCALSFLEAQALAKDLGALRRERVEPPTPISPASTMQRPAQRVGYPLIALAMAASFLLAFGLGLAMRQNWSPGGDAIAPQVAENDALPKNDADSGSLHSPLAERVEGGDQPRGNVTLVMGGQEPAQQQRVEVPLYDYDQVGQDFFTTDQSALTPEMREMLKRHGHEVRRHRQLVPVELQDGQRAVFPMEDFEIVPVRMPAF